MRALRFVVAAICGMLVTGYVYEHRSQVEQLLTGVDGWELGVGREVPADLAAPEFVDVDAIRVVPVALPERSETPVTPEQHSAPSPTAIWNVVDTGLHDARSYEIPVRTVSETIIAARPSTPVSTTTAAATKWEIIGHSAGNKPIHIRKTGVGADVTLIVAGLDGEDRIAVKWVDQLSQRIDESPELVADRQLILLRAVNPDGLTVKKTANANGVFLHRNFPTASYRSGGEAGLGPASEPETRAVLKLLSEVRPQRIIHVQSAHKTAAVSNARSPSVLHAWQQALQTRPQPFDAHHQPGSLEDYAATVLNVDVISLQLPTGDDWRSAGLTHVPTLLAMSAPVSTIDPATATIALKDPATDHSLAASPFSTVDDADAPAEPPRPVRKGYEELPPPPFKPNW